MTGPGPAAGAGAGAAANGAAGGNSVRAGSVEALAAHVGEIMFPNPKVRRPGSPGCPCLLVEAEWVEHHRGRVRAACVSHRPGSVRPSAHPPHPNPTMPLSSPSSEQARFVLKYRHSDAKLSLRVTDDVKVRAWNK